MYNGLRIKMIETKKRGHIIELGKFEVRLNETQVSYTLRRSLKARLIWLSIRRNTGLIVTVPLRYSLKYLPDYLAANSRWILKNLARYCQEPVLPNQVQKINENTVSYLGKCLKVMHKRKLEEGNTVKLQQNTLVVAMGPTASNIPSNELQQWLKQQASELINAKARQYSQQMGTYYNRIVIRDQKSRWGSCSCRKNLNFNWRLIMAPEPVLDYVIIHELCHLLEMSHSRSFWSLVSKYCPQWQEHRSWLDDHCFELNTGFRS
jgi:predicted metal-dependent hydrolase